MARRVRIEELYVGLEGRALLRHLLDGSDEFVAQRTAATRDRLAELDRHLPAAAVPELDVDAGYEAWAPIYDTMTNDLIRADEPLVARYRQHRHRSRWPVRVTKDNSVV